MSGIHFGMMVLLGIAASFCLKYDKKLPRRLVLIYLYNDKEPNLERKISEYFALERPPCRS